MSVMVESFKARNHESHRTLNDNDRFHEEYLVTCSTSYRSGRGGGATHARGCSEKRQRYVLTSRGVKSVRRLTMMQ